MTEEIEESLPDADAAGRVAALTERAIAQKAEVDRLARESKAAAEALRRTLEDDLPNAMRDARLRDTMLDSGVRVILVEEPVGDYPSRKDVETNPDEALRRAAIHEWLAEHGHGGLVRHLVIASFGRDEEEFAEAALAKLSQEAAEGRVTDSKDVNYQQFQAWVREQVRLRDDARARGVRLNVPDIPEETFGIKRLRFARIKEPK